MPESPVLDSQVIENLRSLNPGDDGAFLRELTGLFLEDVPQRLAELDQSMVKGDQSTFARAAHSIKGSSANMGAIALQASAEHLEVEARRSGLSSLAPLVADVRNEFTRARDALTALTK